MKTLIGGIVAAVLGLIGLTAWFGAFLQLLAGALPIMLLLGGALACYLGVDELKDTWKGENASDDMGFQSADSEEAEKLKEELEALRKENEALKTSKDDTGSASE